MSQRTNRILHGSLIVLALGILALSWTLGSVPAAQAAPLATLYVNGANGDDNNDCLAPTTACATITGAVEKAGENDTIQIASGTYFENGISISKRLTLVGADVATSIVDGGQNGRLFILYVDCTLANLTLQNGKTPADPNIFNSGGGAVLVGSGVNVLLQNVLIKDNLAADSGGAIFNSGNLTVYQSTIRDNQANGVGGAIFHYGISASSGITITQSVIENNVAQGIYGGGISVSRRLVVQDSVIRGNQAATYGGGIYVGGFGVTPTTVSMERSTIQGNQAAIGAGMMAESTSHITMTNVTVSSNVASNNYAGIYLSGAETVLTLRNSTVAQNLRTNSAGSGRNGLVVSGGTAILYNSIIADNQDQECTIAGTLISLGHNLSSDNSCNLTEASDLPNTDPRLMPLGAYGGPTLTHALRPGSPAIDAGNNTDCPATDQRGVARPYDGDNSGTATCDIGAVEAEHQLTVADVSVLEGTGGTTSAVFTVTLSPASGQTVTVDYATQNGSATAPSDYAATSGTLTFAPGQTTRTIPVPIVTDGDDEPDETLLVQLSNPTHGVILIGTATGTLLNDDGLPTLNISPVTVQEGNSGSTNAVFAVNLSVASDKTVTVAYATQDGTATQPSDYTANSGTLTFQPGQTTKEISVSVRGDTIDEGVSEQFQVVLSGPTNAVLGASAGMGTITDDDTARMTLRFGPQVVEGDSGTTSAVFTVTLSTSAAFTVTVSYEVVSGFGTTGATAGEDFTGDLDGTLTFLIGETVKNFGVEVIGDLIPEPDEEFRANIAGANVPVDATTAFGKIWDDDRAQLFLPLLTR